MEKSAPGHAFVLSREAFGVRPACWRCRKAGVVRKKAGASSAHSKRFAQFGCGSAFGSASSLLALSEGRGGSESGSKLPHSKRFAQFGRLTARQRLESASSLLALSEGRGGSKAGASSRTPKRFAQLGMRLCLWRREPAKRKAVLCQPAERPASAGAEALLARKDRKGRGGARHRAGSWCHDHRSTRSNWRCRMTSCAGRN